MSAVRDEQTGQVATIPGTADAGRGIDGVCRKANAELPGQLSR
jgi:hypothetical protein